MTLQIANLYAKEFLLHAYEQKLNLNELIANISKFIDYLSDREIMKYLQSPVIKFEKKMHLIKTQINQEIILKLIALISKRKQMGNLLNILNAIISNHKLENNIIEINVHSMIHLNDSQKNNIKLLIKNSFGYEGEIKNVINKTIIGGLLIKFNDYIIDLSIKKQLDGMKKKAFGAIR